jgi:hypothetical protein
MSHIWVTKELYVIYNEKQTDNNTPYLCLKFYASTNKMEKHQRKQ